MNTQRLLRAFGGVVLLAVLATSCAPKINKSITMRYVPPDSWEGVPVVGTQIPASKEDENEGFYTTVNQYDTRNARAYKKDVAYYQNSYERKSAMKSDSSDMNCPVYPCWWMTVVCGWGHRTAPLKNVFGDFGEQFYESLRNGLNIGLSASYFFHEIMGVGLKFDAFKSSKAITNYREKQSVDFFGPTYIIRFFDPSKTHCFFGEYSLGYMGYYLRGRFGAHTATLAGGTLGAAWGMGYDRALSSKWSASVQMSLLAATLKKLNRRSNGLNETLYLKKDEYERLNRLNFSFALRYNL